MKATIDFDEQLNRRLKIEAVRRGLTIRNVVSDAVRQVLDGPPTGSGGPTDAEWTPVDWTARAVRAQCAGPRDGVGSEKYCARAQVQEEAVSIGLDTSVTLSAIYDCPPLPI